MKKAIWFSWENHRRNREVSKALGVTLYEFPEIDGINNPFKKYILGLFKTIRILLKIRPKLIFAQNPSLILSLFVVTLRKIFNYRVIIDAHNVGLFPKEGKCGLLNRLSRFVQRHADLVIVSNPGLQPVVKSNGGKSFVLPDKIPDIQPNSKLPLDGSFKILFICSFAKDEPYLEVIEAARLVGKDVRIYVSGNYRKAVLIPSELPENITLTGYLSEENYIHFLNSVDATIDLTTRENCLVCGAYESVAAGKPVILSDTSALKNYFNQGAIFSENTGPALARAIVQLISQHQKLYESISSLKSIRLAEWNNIKEELIVIQNQMMK